MVEKGQNFGRTESSLRAPDLELRRKVLDRIKKGMGQLDSIGSLTFREEGAKFDPEDILVPSVGIDDSVHLETLRVLRAVGFTNDLPVIFVASKAEKPEGDMITIQGKKLDPNDPASYVLEISLKMLFSHRHISDISLFKRSGWEMGIFFRRGSLHGYLKNNTSADEEAVLLTVDSGDGIPRASFLALPKGWRSTFEKGRLTEETKKVVAPAALPAVALQTPKEAISKIFSKMLELVKNFPEFDGHGDINKKGIKAAQFGNAGTPVEIKIEDGKITLDFSGLNLDKLKRVCEKRELTPSTFSNCFEKEGCGRLVLEVINKGDWTVQFKGKIVRGDPVKDCLVDSPSYFGPSFPAECKRELQGFISELATADFLLSQLNQPKLIPTRVHPTRYPPSNYSVRSNSLPMGGHGVSAHYGGDKVPRFYERDPEQIRREKEAYRTNKAIKRRKGRGKKSPSKPKRRG